MTRHLLVVCTGNICRSPMAVGLLRRRFAVAGLSKQMDVQSAGTFALTGDPAQRTAVELLAQQGIDIRQHRAQQITRGLLNQADLVLVMTEDQRRSIFSYGTHYLSKVFLLSELSGAHEGIPDPYGQDREVYVKVFNAIETFIDAGWEALLERLKIDSG